jgi:hypothetical protein
VLITFDYRTINVRILERIKTLGVFGDIDVLNCKVDILVQSLLLLDVHDFFNRISDIELLKILPEFTRSDLS